MQEPGLDDNLVHEYLAECREHLGTIETDLLAIEQAGAAMDEQVVNRVFRAAHSIKGGAGFFSLTRIRELAHKTESVLDLIRGGQLVPTPEIVNVLLLAFDRLKSLLADHAASNEADIEEFVTALNRLTEPDAGTPAAAPSGEPLTPAGPALPEAEQFLEVSAFDLDQASHAGKHIYDIRFDLLEDIQRRGMTPLEVFRLLMHCGQVLDSATDLEAAGTLDDEPSQCVWLDVLHASHLDSYALGQLLKLPETRVRTLRLPVRQIPLPQAALVAAELVTSAGSALAVIEAGAEVRVATAGVQPEATLRLNVSLLDALMTLAGELVLSRNQLNEAVANGDGRALNISAGRISAVTSELQEAVTLTRMQPVGSVFTKFPRLVRDLARDLGKEVQLRLEGGEVELDKTILEGLSDPLTHMVRNSVDHGVETVAVRRAAGKTAAGTVVLRASHQAGQVVIEVSDDGKGLVPAKIAASALAKGLITREQAEGMTDREKMALIFLPGLSTAEQVSSVSGRGVGMDVVKTNLDRLGGKIEIDSIPGKGSIFRIKLPLTLAIIPSLLISEAGERFAIPQVSVGELIRIPAAKAGERIGQAGGAEVLILRDQLLPLLHLAEVLGLPKPAPGPAINIVQVYAGAFEYGLVVEQLHDTVEIVVKPLGRHLKGLRDYAGATILGSGEVALILDAAGLAERAGIAAAAETRVAAVEAASELQSLLTFYNGPREVCAVPIEMVKRVEKLASDEIELLAGRRTMQYEGESLPLVMLKDVAAVEEPGAAQQRVVILMECAGRKLGLVAAQPLDMIEVTPNLDTVTLRQPGVAGSTILNGRTTLMIDVLDLARSIPGTDGEPRGLDQLPAAQLASATVLIAEDSDFFRNQIQRLVEAVGYTALTANDGQAAWELLQAHAGEVSIVATDVEMPRMDGLSLTRHIRADPRFSSLPVIALSALAGEEEVARGMAAGVTEYQVKLDRDLLIDSIRKSLAAAASS